MNILETSKGHRKVRSRKKDLVKCLKENPREVAVRLEAQPLTSLTRESPGQLSYRIAVEKTMNGIYLLPYVCSWTSKLDSDCRLIYIGFSDPVGSVAGSRCPVVDWGYVGVSPSFA